MLHSSQFFCRFCRATGVRARVTANETALPCRLPRVYHFAILPREATAKPKRTSNERAYAFLNSRATLELRGGILHIILWFEISFPTNYNFQVHQDNFSQKRSDSRLFVEECSFCHHTIRQPPKSTCGYQRKVCLHNALECYCVN